MQYKTLPSYYLSALIFCTCLQAQPWSGILSPARATDWSSAGVIGGIPSASWSQCGATIAPYGSSGAAASPATINTAITSCGTNQYVLLGAGDFYLNQAINLKSNVVLRGAGANSTRLHFVGGIGGACNGNNAAICLNGSNTYGGTCKVNQWPCPAGQWNSGGVDHTANWTGGYSQGSTAIVLDSVTGIVPNLTPIVLDQCDTGFTGSSGAPTCVGASGAITAASVVSGGSGYVVGDTGTISCQTIFGTCYGGSPVATYKVTGVSSGAVTSFSITNGGGAYTYTDTKTDGGAVSSPYSATSPTSGSGSGFTMKITGVTSYDNGGFAVCAVAMVCLNQSTANTSRNSRTQSEVVVARSISGNGPYTLTLSHPIMHPNWASSQGPQAWWGSSTITNAGVENLLIDMSGTTNGLMGVSIMTAYNVWVKGIASSTANVLHVAMFVSSNVSVRDSYFYWTRNGGTTSYGVGSSGSLSNCLIENNIMQGIVDPIVFNGSGTGCVVTYNFAVNNWDTSTAFLFASHPMHAAASDYILEEGNIGAGVNQDCIHGPHLADTFYRNYFNGYESNNGTMPQYSTLPVIVGALSRYNNYIGNVLGSPGYHTIYQCVPGSPSEHYCSTDSGSAPGNKHIWDVGFSHVSQVDYNNAPGMPNDLLTASSFMRWGNWDVVTNAARWCGNSANTGWSTTCLAASEVPTNDPEFPVAIPTLGDTGAHQSALPASLAYTGKPVWWPSGKAWPPIGPDVTTGNIGQCTGGTFGHSKAISASQCLGGTLLSPASTAGSHAVSIPAMDCYLNVMRGNPDGTGAMGSFSAATCYAGGSGGTVNPPGSLTGADHPGA